MTQKEQINKNKLPKHIAIIMDGNGRWAKQRGKNRVFGHKNGVKAVREATEAAAELGVGYLTLYAFSTENWNRPETEINALMGLLVSTIHKEINTLLKNNIKLHVIGNRESLPEKVKNEIESAIEQTAHNTGLNLVIALSYSGRWEITNAVKKIAEKVKSNQLAINDIDDNLFSDNLTTAGMPDPELLIRTSSEYRISNFLLWQIAYAELYFPDVLWPDFRKEHLYDAILNFQGRERRFGKISEQLK